MEPSLVLENAGTIGLFSGNTEVGVNIVSKTIEINGVVSLKRPRHFWPHYETEEILYT